MRDHHLDLVILETNRGLIRVYHIPEKSSGLHLFAPYGEYHVERSTRTFRLR